MNPLGKIDTTWSPTLAYAVGLITTDGSLSKDGRHINFTSKDEQQVENFKKCLRLTNKIGRKANSSIGEKKYYVIQFGDINFYHFLLEIGLMPNKSKILAGLNIPDKYFLDFLRGHFDGDGYCYSYWDKRWENSFMFYVGFISASEKHINWLRDKIKHELNIEGHVNRGKRALQLKYAKTESLRLLQKLYYEKNIICLNRKREKIDRVLMENKIKK